MEDWRLNGQEEYLTNAVLYKITFPKFWEQAYVEKNAFYQTVLKNALDHMKHFPNAKNYLQGEKIQHFWHEHCDFCWDKAMTDIECEFYCTKDMRYWICKKCFDDFKDKFGWRIKNDSL
ncbi:MAG: hypothetical protein IJW55_05180 [Clostridia bacterium]|nr:hypothetical protein [Clostridia bacterium]